MYEFGDFVTIGGQSLGMVTSVSPKAVTVYFIVGTNDIIPYHFYEIHESKLTAVPGYTPVPVDIRDLQVGRFIRREGTLYLAVEKFDLGFYVYALDGNSKGTRTYIISPYVTNIMR